MPHKPKGKGSKRRVAATTPQPSKNKKKAHQAQVTVEQSLADEEVSFREQGDLEHQLCQMMDLISALSDRVNAAEAQKTSREKFPSFSPNHPDYCQGQDSKPAIPDKWPSCLSICQEEGGPEIEGPSPPRGDILRP